jgi:hypothetical protein
MRINGEWYLCDDGAVRPILRAEVLTVTGTWEQTFFLVDTGADRTVFNAALYELTGHPGTATGDRVGGIGGFADAVDVPAEIQLTADDGATPVFRGTFAALMQHEMLDMSVLGRDVLDLFAVIVDRPGDTIALIGQRHRYSVFT